MTEHGSPLDDLDVRLDDGNQVPVYAQLADQLRWLIRGGRLPVGSTLPATRALAMNLGVNRNTVLKAYQVIAREGLVDGRRGGGTVVVRAERQSAAAGHSVPPKVASLVHELLQAATGADVAPDRLVAYVASRAEAMRRRRSLRVGFVECNPDSLGHFVDRIREAFWVDVVPILIDDLPSPHYKPIVDTFDCVISTFFHLAEIRRILRASGETVELFAIAVQPHITMIDALNRLPRAASIGVLYHEGAEDAYASDRLRRMTEMVHQTANRDARIVPMLVRGPLEPQALVGLDALVIRPENVDPIRSSIPGHLEMIEFVNDLDDASRAYLGELFEDLADRRLR
jgi:DNA-binding transcriptional regulator YhcF (GntR family)